VGGLDAALAGSLASFVETLLGWRKLLAQPVRPYVWGTRARALLRDFFDIRDEQDRLTSVRLDQSLQTWLDDCAQAGFDEEVPLAVLREAWLGGADESSLNQRFVSGGVTFCTLMPMRAVPFRVVCLLGMNDGDYPRRAQHADFDLLAQPGLSRPGDRSRRDDDRYLMLEALLAARDKLYISWVGRDVRDNSVQPASILVSQLQDYLRAGWNIDPAALTTEHPLQPFSRRYFDGSGMRTYAKEWRAAHIGSGSQKAQDIPRWDPGTDLRLGLKGLARFIRQPAAAFFHERLGVYFSQQVEVGRDDEPFFLSKLEEYDVVRSLLDDSGELEARSGVEAVLRERAARLGRKGMLPIGHAGRQWQEAIVQVLVPVRSVWVDLCRQYPHSAPRLPVSIVCGGIRLEDWIDKLHSDGEQTAWLDINPGKVLAKVKSKDVPRADKLIHAWLRQLAAAAAGYSVTGYIVARDRLLVLAPLEQEHSQRTLEHLVSLWRAGMDSPLPTACRTALQLLAGGDPRSAYDGGYQGFGEAGDACLARLWPSFEALSAEPDWENCSRQLYGPLHEWVESGVADFPLDGVPMQKQEAA
jgi:exodeoxyribonuclease V gamma subunit